MTKNPTHARADRLSRPALALGVLGISLTTAGLATASQVGFAAGIAVSPGVVGVLWGGLLLASLFVLPPSYTAAAGFVVAAALVPGGFSGLAFAPIGLGLLCVLIAPFLGHEDTTLSVLVATAVLGVLVASAGGVFLWTDDLVFSLGALLGAFALLAYGIHRYELLRLGLIEEAI